MKHIGFIGLAGSGKDTAADALMFTHYRCSFASRLKGIARMLGWDGEKDERGRAFLQDLGMAVRRFDEDTWVRLLREEVSPVIQQLVFTDVRFQNEADFVRSVGGIVVRIVRPGIIAQNHESELKQCEIAADIEIVNDGSVADLHKKIQQLIQ